MSAGQLSVSSWAQSGARMGDVVVAVDGKPVSCLDDVVSALDLHEPGESARLTVLRPVDRKAADELRPNVRRTEVDLVIFLEASNPDCQNKMRLSKASPAGTGRERDVELRQTGEKALAWHEARGRRPKLT
eukprot:CAMPEP_0170649468 /NCGR_PEP_ID=MMETSP0224-20130122/45304_1 /TAXON_ID=285029 /ORGANISM="Togula jolla, Strain CCCM 725" /LENGTH=130 /DNA_ID=CAMNT_0010981103 /DNA_START=88 /DNA_END=482 /DNA_ORIENTATION=-